MAEDRLDAALTAILADELPANVALMRLLAEARSAAEADATLRAREASADGPEQARLRALLDLLEAHPEAWSTVRAVLAEARHDGPPADAGAGVAHWSAAFDRLARFAPEAGVALYALGSPKLLADATDEVVCRMDGWGLLGPGRRLLEIGCGIGRLAIALTPRMGSVLGVDVSGEMVSEARRRAGPIPNLAFRQTSGRDLAGIAAGSVDLVLAADVFPYLVAVGGELAGRHIEEAARVLRPGGALLILNYSYRGDPDRDRAEVQAAFATWGLAIERAGTRDFSVWDGAAYLGRK